MSDEEFKKNIKTISNNDLLEQMEFMSDGYYFELVDVCLEELRCRLEATRWHYPSKGEYPTENGKYLVDWRGEYGEHIDIDQWSNGRWLYIGEVVAWQYIVPPKEEA